MSTVRKINVKKTFDSTWEYEVSAGEDRPTAKISYTDNFEGWASRAPLVNSSHPDIPALKLDKLKAKRLDGGQIKVELEYIALTGTGVPGRPAENPAATAKYYVQVSANEEHILSNEFAADLDEAEIKALYAISNGTQADENGVAYETTITSETGLALLAKIRKGNTHYKTGSIIYGERKVITSLADLQITLFGKQFNPPGGVGGGATKWLYVSASADPVATDEVAWQADRQWQYSPDGWDDDLYGPT